MGIDRRSWLGPEITKRWFFCLFLFSLFIPIALFANKNVWRSSVDFRAVTDYDSSMIVFTIKRVYHFLRYPSQTISNVNATFLRSLFFFFHLLSIFYCIVTNHHSRLSKLCDILMIKRNHVLTPTRGYRRKTKNVTRN